jgi:hypothetical protein
MGTRAHILLASCATVALLACEGDLQSTDRKIGALELPARGTFNLVSDAMQLRCGTLDCHGQTGRNLRLFGYYGMRLDPTESPLGNPTTHAEYDACYWSVVGLEPETMAKVADNSSTPLALSMVRKPRGVEKHKGGQLMVEGDNLDRCIVGWLVGAFEQAACSAIVEMPRPEPRGGT